jgi:cell division protein FtsI/penicillin-binding protein 2
MIRKNFAKEYKFKLLWIVTVFFFLFFIIFVRLFLLQIYQKDFFSCLAHEQHCATVKIDQPRATIYDRSGITPLAFNHEVSSLFILPGQLNNTQRTEHFLLNHYKDVYVRLKANPERRFLWVDRKITPQHLSFIKEQKLDDLQIINESQRFYSCCSMAQIIGFTDIDNNGLAGLELLFNKRLAGSPAVVKIEKDARAQSLYFNKVVDQKGISGQSITLTLDNTLQFLAEEELKKNINFHNAKGGSALIMEPTTGQILAMVNYPNFDPNKKGITNLEATKNNVITDCFELGSVVKAFCALAAYEERVVAYDELIDCEGKVTFIDGFRVENWKDTGIVPFYDVIKHSSNVGIAKIAKRLGPKLYEHLRRLGFGYKTGIEFPGERSGFVNSPEHWSNSSILVMSFGYEIMASILQLGRAFCVIANGGYSVAPTLLKNPPPVPFRPNKLYRDDTIQNMKNTLEWIGVKYPIQGYRVLGKTGTARCVKEGKYSKTAHVYTFAGIVEKDAYKRVIVTFVREPSQSNLWASGVAGTLFQRIAEKMVLYETMNNSHPM